MRRIDLHKGRIPFPLFAIAGSIALIGWLASACSGAGAVGAGVHPDFRTTPPARLYFLNTRSSAYTQRSDPSSRIDYYRLRSWPDPGPGIMPVLADNWMQDEAYLWLMPAEGPRFRSDTLQLYGADQGLLATLALDGSDPASHLEASRKVLQALNDGQALTMSLGKAKPVRVFEDPEARQRMAQIRRDLLALIEDGRK